MPPRKISCTLLFVVLRVSVRERKRRYRSRTWTVDSFKAAVRGVLCEDQPKCDVILFKACWCRYPRATYPYRFKICDECDVILRRAESSIRQELLELVSYRHIEEDAEYRDEHPQHSRFQEIERETLGISD